SFTGQEWMFFCLVAFLIVILDINGQPFPFGDFRKSLTVNYGGGTVIISLKIWLSNKYFNTYLKKHKNYSKKVAHILVAGILVWFSQTQRLFNRLLVLDAN
ncbi:hypothetical protein ACJX0J_036077, partial [Zea mays]